MKKKIIQKIEGMNNLSFINAGNPICQNPGEIILNEKMNRLFEYLKKNYEFIILNTPPVEAVSDALTLNKWADIFVFVIRHKYSNRSSVELINKLSQDSKTSNTVLVINSIQPGGDFKNVHGYGYGYSTMNKYHGKKKSKAKSFKNCLMYRFRNNFRGYFSFYYKIVGNRLIVFLLLSIIISFLDGLGLAMFIPLLQSVALEEETVSHPSLSQLNIVNGLFDTLGFDLTLSTVLLMMVTLFILKGLMRLTQLTYYASLRQLFIKKVRKNLVNNLQQLSF